MTVFKTFLKVLNKCKGTVILYTVILVAFGAMQMQSNESSMNFVASKPDILIVNRDEEAGITKGLIQYLKKHAEFIEIEDEEEARDDALFYRNVNYIIYIPEHYNTDFFDGRQPELEVKTTNDYQAYYAQLLVERYIKTAEAYRKNSLDTGERINENELIKQVDQTAAKETEIEMTSKLDTNQLSRAAFYFNFMNYGLLAGAIFTICMVLTSFQEEKIRRRTMISSMPVRKHNRILLFANALFALILWAVYAGLGFILCGTDVIAGGAGAVLLANSFVFTICAVTLAFLLANLIHSKNALNGIINVIALGTSFLCGAFVPAEWLPDGVLKAAHILPSYWYIQTNELVKTTDTWNAETLKPVFINIGVVLAFSIGFIVLANLLSARKKEGK